MTSPSLLTSDQLAEALQALGVRFLSGASAASVAQTPHPMRLIVALAESREARLRLSLIPLFLEHPEFARHARPAAEALPGPARLTLQCYYTAAMCLQQLYPQLCKNLPRLPDKFSPELGVTLGPDQSQNLARLATRHRALDGAPINWLGTYQHAARTWLAGLKRQKA